MAEFGPVADRGVDVEHRHLPDERVVSQGDRARLNDPVVGPIAVEECVLPDHRTIADGEHVGADGYVSREDRNVSPDLRTQRPKVERVER
jgi:hypothetical protein